MAGAREEWRAVGASMKKMYKSVLKQPDPVSSDSDDEGNENDGTDDTSSLPSYKYETSLDANTIRLVELQPGPRGSPVVCQLREHRLDTPVEYEALSYVWGSSTDLKRITVDGKGFLITPHLYRALLSLRNVDHSRHLWVDAICINQVDDEERRLQVPLMREVYRDAASTICYVGPRRNTTRGLVDMLEELAQEGMELRNTKTTTGNFDTLTAFVNHVTINPVKSSLADKYRGDISIVILAGCQWWNRAWTVQELLLSKCAIFMLGRRTIKWETICHAVDHGINLSIWGSVSFGFVINEGIVPYLSMRALMNCRQLQVSNLEQSVSTSSANELLHLLAHCRHRASSDPRDKVYAVLGLLLDAHSQVLIPNSQDTLDIKLDYSHPVVYVYRKIAQTLIAHLDNLDVLGVCPKSTRSGLPSWATDWSVTGHLGSPLTHDSLDRPRRTHATRNSVAQAQFPDDGVTMILSGHEISTIEQLTEVLPSIENDAPEEIGYHNKALKFSWSRIFGLVIKEEHELFRTLMSIYETLFAWSQFATVKKESGQPQDLEALFWQTLCGGTYCEGGVEATASLYKAWFDKLKPIGEFMEKYSSARDHMPEIAFAKLQYVTWESYGEFWSYIACAQHRRMGRAKNGWLCLLPKDSRVGDRIMLAKGGRVPLVLRLNDDGYHTFIGETYIHGIMDGEAFEMDQCRDIRIC